MTQDERQEKILKLLERGSSYLVSDLAARFNVTGATIRNDIRLLESRHQLRRGHGTVMPVKLDVTDLPVDEKYKMNSEEKHGIGRMAASLIQEGNSVIITSGSSIEAMARAFPDGSNINVVTSSVRVAGILNSKNGLKIFMLGGRLVHNSVSVRDDYTLMGLDNIHANYLFFSCDGFDPESGITTAFPEEARLTCKMMECAQEKILLADSSKLGKIGFGKICNLSDIDILITDSGLSPARKEQIEATGVRVLIA